MAASFSYSNCRWNYGFGVGAGSVGSPRFLSCGGPSDDELLEPPSVSAGSPSGCRRFKVGLPLPSSSKSVVTPALAFVSLSRWALTRLNSDVLITYSSFSEKRATRTRLVSRRSIACGCDEKSFATEPGFFLFFDASFSNIVDIDVGS